MEKQNEIRNRALSEWEHYAGHTKGFRTEKAVRLGLYGEDGWATNPDVAGLSKEGFIIDTDAEFSSICAKGQRGLLYGVTALINACGIAGNKWVDLNVKEDPHFKTRLLWSWGRIDNTYRHSPYMKFPSLINSTTMADPESNPEMMRFIRNMSQMRVNSLAITHELHHGDIKDYDQHGFRPYYQSIRHFSKYLKSWGIDVYLYTASAPEPAWKRGVANTDCPYDPRIREFFLDYVDEICTELPDIKGLLLAGGLGGYAGGTLYDCRCEYCAGKSFPDKITEQVQMIASLLAKYNNNLIYTLSTDIPFTMDREVEPILEMFDKVPENVLLSFKDCYHDFEDLRYPEHPLLGRLEALELKRKTPFAVEYQLFPEMRGKGVILTNAVRKWCEIFKLSGKLNMKGVVGVIETHPDNAHPSMADWYAWGRLSWNPELDAEQILKEWAAKEYPHEVNDILAHVLDKSYDAAAATVYAGGVQCGIHGMMIPFPHFIRDIVNDTWCKKEKLPEGIIGNDERQVGLYTKKRADEIMNDPSLILFTKSHQVDSTLKERLLSEKENAIQMYSMLYEEWLKTENRFGRDDYRFMELLKMLRKNVVDAQRFYIYFKTFLEWQSGELTGEGIEEVRKQYLHSTEECSLNTSDELLGALLQHLEYTIKGIPFKKDFDCMCDLPQFDQKVWQEGKW